MLRRKRRSGGAADDEESASVDQDPSTPDPAVSETPATSDDNQDQSLEASVPEA